MNPARSFLLLIAAVVLVYGGIALADRSDVWSSSSSRVHAMCFHREGARVRAVIYGTATKPDAGVLSPPPSSVLLPQGGGVETSVLSLMNGAALTQWKGDQEL